MDKYRDVGLLILRLGFGLAFVWYHGLPKLMGGPEGWERTGSAMENIGITFGYPAWGVAAALTETLGGLLFAAGLFFRPASVALLTIMVVATVEQFSRAMPMPEHALKNAFVFAGMFFVGPGRYTIARVAGRR